ncbi:hypothetical protein J6590_000995 [Homalodisca vitripennis]|nr:hypothetical protein J6590_000995 [Homalodisca vitripennis]
MSPSTTVISTLKVIFPSYRIRLRDSIATRHPLALAFFVRYSSAGQMTAYQRGSIASVLSVVYVTIPALRKCKRKVSAVLFSSLIEGLEEESSNYMYRKNELVLRDDRASIKQHTAVR